MVFVLRHCDGIAAQTCDSVALNRHLRMSTTSSWANAVAAFSWGKLHVAQEAVGKRASGRYVTDEVYPFMLCYSFRIATVSGILLLEL